MFAAAAGGSLGLDLLSKWLIFRAFGESGPVVLIPRFLALHCTSNTGGLFGLGRGYPFLFVPFALVAVGAILWIFFTLRDPRRRLVIALGLVLGGAVGNLADRLYFHAVRDFIVLHAGRFTWPTFNLADAAITIGALILVVTAWTKPQEKAHKAA